MIDAAKNRYPEYFEYSEQVRLKLHDWIHNPNNPSPQSDFEYIIYNFLVRAFNIYKSISILLEQDYWEEASILSRSLFELLLNLEELSRDPNNSKRFIKFHLLQALQHHLNLQQFEMEREKKKDTSGINDGFLKRKFPEFVIKGKSSKFSSSWCNKTVRDLAKDSNKLHYYKIIYSLFSYFTHSGPFSIGSVMKSYSSEYNEMLRELNTDEGENILAALTLSTLWILLITSICQPLVALYDPIWCQRNLEKLKAFNYLQHSK